MNKDKAKEYKKVLDEGGYIIEQTGNKSMLVDKANQITIHSKSGSVSIHPQTIIDYVKSEMEGSDIIKWGKVTKMPH